MPARAQGSGSWPRRTAKARMQASTDRQCLIRFLFVRCCLSSSKASSRVIAFFLSVVGFHDRPILLHEVAGDLLHFHVFPVGQLLMGLEICLLYTSPSPRDG